jgi:ribosome biogenesis GTPase
VVGDWVAAEIIPTEEKALIHAVLPRRTKFSRTMAGGTTDEQILSANVDDVFIVAALAGELNLRRIERYLALAHDSGAAPTIVLTKLDLCENAAAAKASVQELAGKTPVLALSNISGKGVKTLRRAIRPGHTAVLLGPSGVGKSTLVNYLCGEELLAVQPVREDDQKGRHTTTRRELLLLRGGGLIIDTPGMRELQLWEGDAGITDAFEDVAALAAGCRFSDCTHGEEPECAVRAAMVAGTLTAGRLESYRKLRSESASFGGRSAERVRDEKRRRIKAVTRSLRGMKERDFED